VENHKDRKNQT